MKKLTLSLCTVVALTSFGFAGGDIAPVEEPVIVVAPATSDFYVGLGLSAISARTADANLNFFDSEVNQDRMLALALVAGYDFNEYFAVEGRYTTSVGYDDEVEMKGWSLFVKPQYPVTEDFTVYALLGYGGVILTDATSDLLDDSGFQWGIGASYDVMDNVSIFADYTSLANDMDQNINNPTMKFDTDALTLGVNYHF